MRFAAVLMVIAALCTNLHAQTPDADLVSKLVTAARAQVGVTTTYNGSYQRLDYPGGDVAIHTGVCTDVVIRTLRAVGIDLQRAVYEDRKAFPQRYVINGKSSPRDRNIDHRRVPNQQIWFRHHAQTVALDADYQAGDIVTWKLPGNLDHTGVVSDRRVAGRPLILHNIGRGAQEEDVLNAWPITGHFRLRASLTVARAVANGD